MNSAPVDSEVGHLPHYPGVHQLPVKIPNAEISHIAFGPHRKNVVLSVIRMCGSAIDLPPVLGDEPLGEALELCELSVQVRPFARDSKVSSAHLVTQFRVA